jgi:hypothetical protein
MILLVSKATAVELSNTSSVVATVLNGDVTGCSAPQINGIAGPIILNQGETSELVCSHEDDNKDDSIVKYDVDVTGSVLFEKTTTEQVGSAWNFFGTVKVVATSWNSKPKGTWTRSDDTETLIVSCVCTEAD